MADVRITCINKPNRNSSHENITHVGGSSWKWKSSDVIVSIENGTNTFYTMVNGKRADVHVIKGTNGKHLRTYADGVLNDNLLALPECP